MPDSRIYLDHASTTPLLPEAREAMAPWLESDFGNASSLHAEGRRARQAIDEAREAVSGAIGSLFAEVLFTSSATEAANMAILGSALAPFDANRKRIVFGAAEHHCVLHTAENLARLGFRVEQAPVDSNARIDLDALADLLGEDVLLVAVMHANNEVGTIQPVADVAELAHRVGARFFCDAVQTFGWQPWKVEDLGADFVALSAHKLGGPKGCGAIYIRAGVKIAPLLVGGGQEREMRAGTENVAAIAGFAAACRTQLTRPDLARRRREARDTFLDELDRLAPEGLEWTVQPGVDRLEGHAHLRFAGVSAESVLIRLDRLGIAASSGAACSSGSLEPSHVLLACGWSEDQAREGLRFTFGWTSTSAQARKAARIVAEAVDKIRSVRRP